MYPSESQKRVAAWPSAADEVSAEAQLFVFVTTNRGEHGSHVTVPTSDPDDDQGSCMTRRHARFPAHPSLFLSFLFASWLAVFIVDSQF